MFVCARGAATGERHVAVVVVLLLLLLLLLGYNFRIPDEKNDACAQDIPVKYTEHFPDCDMIIF